MMLDARDENQRRRFGMDAAQDARVGVEITCPACGAVIGKPVRVAFKALSDFLKYVDLADATIRFRLTANRLEA